MTSNETFNLLVGVTGSVATIKLRELIQKIHSLFPRETILKNSNSNVNVSLDIKIKIVMTKHSQHFILKEQVQVYLINSNVEVYDDYDEWSQWKEMGDPVLHIELRKWADLFLIAPLDANTMAKMCNGICDNLLTCIVRAWDMSKPLVYCPAMNVNMYQHPLTQEQMSKMKSFGYICIEPIEKTLACGDFGIGAMASIDTIADKVIEHLNDKITFSTWTLT